MDNTKTGLPRIAQKLVRYAKHAMTQLTCLNIATTQKIMEAAMESTSIGSPLIAQIPATNVLEFR